MEGAERMKQQEFIGMSANNGLLIITYNDIELIWKLHPYKDAVEIPSDFEHISIGNLIREIEEGSNHKPIIHPLSDLTKEIEHNGERFVPIKLFSREDQKDIEIAMIESSFIELLSFYIIQKLIEWHFDIAGLIEKGEAIDVNTLKTNPYL